MADNHSVSLLDAMDRLWFHKIILFSESTALLVTKTLKQPQLGTGSVKYPSSSSNFSSEIPLDEEISFASSVQDGETLSEWSSNSLLDDSNNEEKQREDNSQKERRTGVTYVTRRVRSRSSSPSSEKPPKKIRHSSGRRQILKKSMSCRSLGELELEEVKGFMDLGFTFKEEHLSPRMMSVLPGLQRLGLCRNKQNIDLKDGDVPGEDEIKEEKKGITRPYLSEAWLIKRPDSPLLNLRIPRVTAAADMKKHLRIWARTVASVIGQES